MRNKIIKGFRYKRKPFYCVTILNCLQIYLAEGNGNVYSIAYADLNSLALTLFPLDSFSYQEKP